MPRAKGSLGEKVECPDCGHLVSRVMPWSKPKGTNPTARRRSCTKCGCIVQTVEQLETVIRHGNISPPRNI